MFKLICSRFIQQHPKHQETWENQGHASQQINPKTYWNKKEKQKVMYRTTPFTSLLRHEKKCNCCLVSCCLLFLFFIGMYVCLRECIPCEGPQSPEDSLRSPGPRITDSCEPQTLILWKTDMNSKQCLQPPNGHL